MPESKKNNPHDGENIRNPEGISYKTASTKEVINAYASRKITYNRAASLLETKQAIGALWAGEISIEEAFKYRNYEDFQPLLMAAHGYFTVAEKRGLGKTLGRDCNDVARARLYKANIFAFAGICVGTLPNELLTKRIYNQTINIGHALSTQHARNTETNTNLKEITSSCINSVAITAILQRELVNQFDEFKQEYNDEMPAGWFVIPSTVSKRYINAKQRHIDNTWHIELLENPLAYGRYANLNNPIEVATKIRISLDQNLLDPKTADPTIRRVSIYPDLRIADTRGAKIAHSILEDCLDEITNPDNCLAATERLDTRAALLFEKLKQD